MRSTHHTRSPLNLGLVGVGARGGDKNNWARKAGGDENVNGVGAGGYKIHEWCGKPRKNK